MKPGLLLRGGVLASLLALGACASAPRKEPPPGIAAPPAVVDVVPADATRPESDAPPAPTVSVPVPPATPWDRLRAGLAFSRCDANRDARRWQGTYTRGASRFAENLERSLPFMIHVLGEIEKRGLPTEFALLPVVESWYVPVRSRGNNPAGIWQIMPATARNFGLEISSEYDGRLDVPASTRAALDLIEYLGRSFNGDWRLVNMGYNAGEFRIRRALPRGTRSDGKVRYRKLPVSRITHEHLAKLEALSCVVREPQRFAVSLPVAEPRDTLAVVVLDAALDIELAAQLADLSPAQFRRLNAASFGPTIRAGHTVLLPAHALHDFQALLARVPAPQRTGWRRMALRNPTAWPALARDSDIDASVLAAIHRRDGASLATRGEVLVRSHAQVAQRRASAPEPAREGRYAVNTGDSLWRIARRFGVGVDALLGWNQIKASDVLRPGQVLWVSEPQP